MIETPADEEDPAAWVWVMHRAGLGQDELPETQRMSNLLDRMTEIARRFGTEPPQPVTDAIWEALLRLQGSRACSRGCGPLEPADEDGVRHCPDCDFEVSIEEPADVWRRMHGG